MCTMKLDHMTRNKENGSYYNSQTDILRRIVTIEALLSNTRATMSQSQTMRRYIMTRR